MIQNQLSRRVFTVAALASAWAAGASAQAPAYPSRPVKLIVAAAAGSSPDAIGRQLSTKLDTVWSQPVLVENVVGLGGIVGTERAAKAPADGYTVLLSTIGAMAISGSLMDKLPYDPVKDFAPLTLAMAMPNLLVVHPSVPAANVQELIAYAKKNPGKLRYGHPGTGTSPHLAGELLKHMAGIDMMGVPYKSSAQMMTDLLAGHYDVLFHNSSVVLPHAQAGAARILGITSLERSTTLPEIPALAETPALHGFAVNAWWGLYAPAGTPPALVARISTDMATALSQPDVKAWIDKQGGSAGGGTPAALATLQASETQKWRELIKSANIKAD